MQTKENAADPSAFFENFLGDLEYPYFKIILLAQGVMTDLDGPLLLAEDRDNPLIFDDAGVHPPKADLWG